MENIPMIIISLGILLIFIGLFWNLGAKIGLGSLPGDFKIDKGNFKFYFPLTTSIIISIILSLIFFIFQNIK